MIAVGVSSDMKSGSDTRQFFKLNMDDPVEQNPTRSTTARKVKEAEAIARIKIKIIGPPRNNPGVKSQSITGKELRDS